MALGGVSEALEKHCGKTKVPMQVLQKTPNTRKSTLTNLLNHLIDCIRTDNNDVLKAGAEPLPSHICL